MANIYAKPEQPIKGESPQALNKSRVIAKSRLEKIAHGINEAAARARDIHDFKWIIEDSVAKALPKSYFAPLTSRHFVFCMYTRYLDRGYCLSSTELREIEGAINDVE